MSCQGMALKTIGRLSSYSTMWGPGIELGSSELMKIAFNQWRHLNDPVIINIFIMCLCVCVYICVCVLAASVKVPMEFRRMASV